MGMTWSDKGDMNTLKYLLEKGAMACLEETDSNTKRTPLLWACSAGKVDAMKILIETGANVNAKDKEGRTCLMTWSEKGDMNMLKYLLEKGADINEEASDGNT